MSATPASHAPKVRYRKMALDDIPRVIELEAASFPGIPPDRYWQPDMLRAHIEKFAEGQFVAEIDGRILGSATSMLTRFERAITPHRWRDIAGGGYLTTHVPGGDVLYGTEIMVHPDARRRGLGRTLYKMRRDLTRQLNCRAQVTGGRIPGYGRVAERMSAVEYVKSVLRGDRADRTLSAQLSAGFTVAGIMPNYLTDPASLNNATLLVWWNLDWVPTADSGRGGP